MASLGLPADAGMGCAGVDRRSSSEHAAHRQLAAFALLANVALGLRVVAAHRGPDGAGLVEEDLRARYENVWPSSRIDSVAVADRATA